MDYREFLEGRSQIGTFSGFDPLWMPDRLFDFQKALTEWAIRKGKAAIFADCGLGKTFCQLVFGENVVRKTNKHVLILTPLSVGLQTVKEGEKFGVQCFRSRAGELPSSAQVVVTNYEQLDKFNPNDFAGVVCDESGILKHVDSKTRAAVTEFMRTREYRLLCTATAAPNDYVELGNSAEALGEMGFQDMVTKFFKKGTKGGQHRWSVVKYTLKGHATRDFWRWVCSWSRAIRKPSDMGFPDGDFVLPPLHTNEHVVQASVKPEGWLFDRPAITLEEQREERRRTLKERCEKVCELVTAHKGRSIAWCHLNDEGDMLEKILPKSEQVSGKDSDERKEEVMLAFLAGQFDNLITKASLFGYGLNLQCCNHMTVFPSNSFEQYYQLVRRCWRFGQQVDVTVDMVNSEGERGVLENLQRKAVQADDMFSTLVSLMGNELRIRRREEFTQNSEVPAWMIA